MSVNKYYSDAGELQITLSPNDSGRLAKAHKVCEKFLSAGSALVSVPGCC
jgi:hypothetical protein